jgi:hypothetical protein
MTNQELFDRVASHLLRQGAASIDETSPLDSSLRCRYRGPGGLMCAIGCLIPDDRYSALLEGKGVFNHSVRDAAGIGDDNLDLAECLQSIHDEGEPGVWACRLSSVAIRYRLNDDVVRAHGSA